MPHGDGRSRHGDSGSHTDNHSIHIDVGIRGLRHTDHHNHFDAGAHADVPSIHGDTPAVHVDIPSIHIDTR